MDNTRDLPGYKHYLDPETGERPAIYVAYLDLVPDPAACTIGVRFPADADALEALDRRERNYERTDVGGGVWTYLGTRAARERFERGRATNTAFIDRAYYEAVEDSLRRIGGAIGPPPLPVRTLARVDAPLAKAPRRA